MNHFGLGYVKKYYSDHVIYLLVAATVCSITYVLMSFVPDESFQSLIAKGLATVACSGMLLVLIFMPTARFKEARRFLTRAAR